MDAAAEAAGGLSMSDKQIVECDIGVSDEMLDRMIRCVDYGFAAHMAFKELRYYRKVNRQKSLETVRKDK